MKSGGNSANIVETRQKFVLTSNRSCPIIGDMKKRDITKEDWDKAVQFYRNASTMVRENEPLYACGIRRGWVKDTVWPDRMHHSSYTKEDWDEGVQLHGNAKTMRKENPALYKLGWKQGWLKDTIWPRPVRRGISEQLKERVFEHSRECGSRGEFKSKYPNDYDIARKYGWLNEMYWLKPKLNPVKDRINYIYLYLFEEQNYFYVGETHHGSIRDSQHRKSGPVFEFAEKNNIEIPEPIILEDNLDRIGEVRKREDYWKNRYISLGYNTLNKGKTGEFSGSLGRVGIKWTRKKCREAALLCSSRTEMQLRFPGAYGAAWRNGWLDDYTWFAPALTKPREVLQYTTDGRFVERWGSISLAARATGLWHSAISRCCGGGSKSSGGFVWRYADGPVQMSLAI